MESGHVFVAALVVGLCVAGYGLYGVIARRIVFIARGAAPRVCIGQDAVEHGIVVAVLGLGLAGIGGLLLLISNAG